MVRPWLSEIPFWVFWRLLSICCETLSIASSCTLPHLSSFLSILIACCRIDRTDYFRHPVNKAEVPDYFDVVKKPMHWSIIEDKINNHSYLYSQEFKVGQINHWTMVVH